MEQVFSRLKAELDAVGSFALVDSTYIKYTGYGNVTLDVLAYISVCRIEWRANVLTHSIAITDWQDIKDILAGAVVDRCGIVQT